MQSIYLAMVNESITRLNAAERYLAAHSKSASLPDLESAILQIRKALESTAYAAIAPNKAEYDAFRAKAEDQPDFRKDFHAGKILNALTKINEHFYPIPLLPAKLRPDGSLHFDRKPSGYLTKKQFESFYDRLGKHLHAHNPWSNNKNLQNLAADLPQVIQGLSTLLELHVTFIQTPSFAGCWIVEAPRTGRAPQIINAVASPGGFTMQGS